MKNLTEWKVHESRVILKTPWFELFRDSCETPSGHLVPEYYTWKKRDGVLVFPVTPDGQAVLIGQYRHGIGRVCIDYPGGTIDDEQTIFDAARHELLEETGYTAESFEQIGSFVMDSSYSNQTSHFLIARECRQVARPSNPQEETVVISIPLGEIETFAEQNISCVLCSLLTLKALRKMR